LASVLNDVSTHCFRTTDGSSLTWRELGVGRPLVLFHGYFSNAQTNWIRYGSAAQLAKAGFRVIMPDLRAHGDSDRSHDPANYPPDILAADGIALLAHLGLADYDLGGYSLGARTVLRMLVKGARPRRAIIAGMGLKGVTDTGSRSAHFRHILNNLGQHSKGTPEWMAEAFLKTSGGDPVALALILDTFVDTCEAEVRAIDLPIGVICGIDDQDNGSAADLAAMLPAGVLIPIPGNHMSAVTKPEFGEAMLAYLAD
jgi:pimeloyl-ACP methyl ester carboxylesterase